MELMTWSMRYVGALWEGDSERWKRTIPPDVRTVKRSSIGSGVIQGTVRSWPEVGG